MNFNNFEGTCNAVGECTVNDAVEVVDSEGSQVELKDRRRGPSSRHASLHGRRRAPDASNGADEC